MADAVSIPDTYYASDINDIYCSMNIIPDEIERIRSMGIYTLSDIYNKRNLFGSYYPWMMHSTIKKLYVVNDYLTFVYKKPLADTQNDSKRSRLDLPGWYKSVSADEFKLEYFNLADFYKYYERRRFAEQTFKVVEMDEPKWIFGDKNKK